MVKTEGDIDIEQGSLAQAKTAEDSIYQLRTQRSYRQRAQATPHLLEKYGVKPQKVRGPKKVIFIVVDSLRKDHLSLYGYERDTTPFLNSLGERTAVFANAVTPSPWIFPAVASILTGLYPHNHEGIHSANPRNFDKECPNKVCEDVLALPEVLTALGFESYFVYGDDPDWCYRFHKAGWRIMFTPEPEIIHYEGQTTKKKADKFLLQLYGSKLIFMRLHRSKLFFPFARVLNSAVFLFESSLLVCCSNVSQK